MINLNELRSFWEASVPPTSALYRKRWSMSPIKLVLKDGQQIMVWSARQLLEGLVDDYSYVMHPEFGVLRLLQRGKVDKSPLCYLLDESIEERL